ncbi:MAG TPA: SDR family oxidoreductase [Myxococcales bacterium LLY-WYZ-16_1]|nr:SDR family oxidoreductase [Myxococcales bacterium LLY-WYZ-16_1]
MSYASSSNPVLLFGGTRGVGLALAQRLRDQGRTVVAMVRRGSDRSGLDAIGVEVAQGNALDATDVARAVARVPAGASVVSTLGPRGPDDAGVDDVGQGHVIEAAQALAPQRFVLVTSIGCGEMTPYRSERMQAALGPILDAKTRAEEALRQSGLPFTIVRPGGLKDGPPTGRAELVEDPAAHGMIHREDVADLVLHVMHDPSYAGKAVAAIDPSL